MHAVLNLIFAIVTAVTGATDTPTVNPAGTQDTVNDGPAVIVAIGADAEQQELLDEALDAYEEAGLELPSMSVSFHADTEPCRGNAGLFWDGIGSTEGTRIDICHRNPLILFHELGHAWVFQNLGEDGRATYMAHWGSTVWNDQDVKHSARANERAANAIAYTLMMDEPTDFEPIVELVCSFELLTSTAHQNLDFVDCAAVA